MNHDLNKTLSPVVKQFIQNVASCPQDHSALISATTELSKKINLSSSDWSSPDFIRQVSIIPQTASSILPSNMGTRLMESVPNLLTSLNSASLENDFVTLDEAPLKEWEIPDTIAVPIGQNRIKIKADLFVSILIEVIFQIIAIIFTVCSSQQSLISDQAYQKEQIRLEQESVQNEYNFLDSIDISMSSMAETIEDLKDDIRVLNSCLQDISSMLSSQEASRESDPALTDNMNESPNTASENKSSYPEE